MVSKQFGMIKKRAVRDESVEQWIDKKTNFENCCNDKKPNEIVVLSFAIIASPSPSSIIKMETRAYS